MEVNRAKLGADWNVDEPIETLWARVTECKAFAEDLEPITDRTAMTLLISAIARTGLFALDVDTYRKKPIADWDLPGFQSHFTAAYKIRADKRTAADAGFHSAQTATTTTPSSQPILDDTTIMRIAAAFASIASTAQMPAAANLVVSALTTPANMHTPSLQDLHYCWTHGFGKNPAHTSATCQRPATGHQATATASNKLGGNERIMCPRRQNNATPPAPGTM